MKGVHRPHAQVVVLEDRSFHRKVLRKLYRNSKFNILAKFINLFYQPHKNFRVSQSLVKDAQRFGQFNHKYFKVWKKTTLTLLYLIKVLTRNN